MWPLLMLRHPKSAPLLRSRQTVKLPEAAVAITLPRARTALVVFQPAALLHCFPTSSTAPYILLHATHNVRILLMQPTDLRSWQASYRAAVVHRIQ